MFVFTVVVFVYICEYAFGEGWFSFDLLVLDGMWGLNNMSAASRSSIVCILKALFEGSILIIVASANKYFK